MLHSMKQTAIRITAVAVLTAGAALPFATSTLAAPAGVGADRSARTWYVAPGDEDGCVSSPGSINHTFCKDAGGGE